MKIGIIGRGRIGTALGSLFSRAGYDVTFGSARTRPEAKDDDRIVGIDEATRAADIVVVAIPFGAWPAFAQDHGAALEAKVVIDTSNTNASRDGAIVEQVKREGVGTLAFVARLVPRAKLVKAFNTMESQVLVEQAGRRGGLFAHSHRRGRPGGSRRGRTARTTDRVRRRRRRRGGEREALR